MGEIQLRATFPNITDEKLDEFQAVAKDAVAAVRREAGALQYDWFLSDDQTKCVVLEKYASSEDVLAHLANAGALIGKLAALGGGLDLEVFGDVSPQLRQTLAAAAPPIYGSFLGL